MIKENVLKTIFERNLGLKSEESFLVVTDTVLEKLGREIFDYSRNYTRDSELVIMEPLERNGQEPPENIREKMMKYDVQILITSKSLTHTNTTKKAVSKGARIITMPGITEDILNRCIDVDYDEMNKLGNKIREMLLNSREVKVTTRNGTNVTLSVRNVRGKNEGDFTQKGVYGNLPSGEIDSGVVEGSVNGRLVIDGSMAGLGVLENPLILEVRNGYVVKIEGKKSDELKRILDSVGKEAYKIAEFGIGINPKAIVSGNVLEDEKVKGTVHFALGNDTTYGGTNNIPLHLDGIIQDATIDVDGKRIVENGVYLIR